jgi:hypothetical protein
LIYEKDYYMPDDIFNGLCKILYPGGGEQGDWEGGTAAISV